MEKPEVKMDFNRLASLSGDVLMFCVNNNLTLAETITVLDSACGIARAKMSNTIAFAGIAQAMANIINGPKK